MSSEARRGDSSEGLSAGALQIASDKKGKGIPAPKNFRLNSFEKQEYNYSMLFPLKPEFRRAFFHFSLKLVSVCQLKSLEITNLLFYLILANEADAEWSHKNDHDKNEKIYIFTLFWCLSGI